jgi:hypothetical protein
MCINTVSYVLINQYSTGRFVSYSSEKPNWTKLVAPPYKGLATILCSVACIAYIVGILAHIKFCVSTQIKDGQDRKIETKK